VTRLRANASWDDLARECRRVGCRLRLGIGPGCDRNGVDVDLSWGVARRIGFGYGVADVIVIREVAR